MWPKFQTISIRCMNEKCSNALNKLLILTHIAHSRVFCVLAPEQHLKSHTQKTAKLYHCRMLKRSREPLNGFSVSKRELNFIQRCWHSMVRLWILWMRVNLICNVIASHAANTKSILLTFGNWIESEHYTLGDFQC